MLQKVKITKVFPAQEISSQNQGAAHKPLKKQTLIITTGIHQFMVEALGDQVDVLSSLKIHEPERMSYLYEVELEFKVKEYTKEGESTPRYFQSIKLTSIGVFEGNDNKPF